MTTIIGTYRDGFVELDAPLGLPNGSRVQVVVPEDQENNRPELKYGLDEATWVDTPENRAALLASMEAYEPPVMTLEEEAEWNAAREAVKQYTLEKMNRTKLPFES
jgi:hypothetical protein